MNELEAHVTSQSKRALRTLKLARNALARDEFLTFVFLHVILPLNADGRIFNVDAAPLSEYLRGRRAAGLLRIDPRSHRAKFVAVLECQIPVAWLGCGPAGRSLRLHRGIYNFSGIIQYLIPRESRRRVASPLRAAFSMLCYGRAYIKPRREVLIPTTFGR